MTSLVESLTIDCHDPRTVAEFWCAVLGYQLDGVDDEGAWISDPSGKGWQLLFLIVPEGKTVKNRLHLDVSPASSMAEEVDRLRGVGAAAIRRVDEHGGFWTVMADPEDNEFCVLRGPDDDPAKGAPRVASLVESLVIDCRAPRTVAAFWCAVLGYQLDGVDDEDAWISDPTGKGWELLFQVVPEGKTVKNRLHLDLSPPSTMAEEVDRLLGVGAAAIRRVDEGGSFWTVMTDPEGNEFCVLRGPEDDPPKERPA